MPINVNQQFEQASIYSDVGTLNKIREQGLNDEIGAVKRAAKEFESLFMNMMLKSMRQSAEAVGGNSLTGSEEEKMFVGMMDEQMAAELSQQGHLGIADLMMSQLERQFEKTSSKATEYKLDNTRVKYNESNLPKSDLHIITNTLSASKSSLTEKLIVSVNPKANSVEVELNDSEIQPKIEMPQKKSLFNEIADFINGLLPHAQKAAEKLKVDPRVLIAQAALETGWGKFIMHDESGKPGFNLFGIKAGKSWNGDSIKIGTLEVEKQQFIKVNASFRKYEGFSESFDDYVNFLQQNPRYNKVIESAGNAKKFVNELQAAGYATDPNYANKIIRIFEYADLQKIELDKD